MVNPDFVSEIMWKEHGTVALVTDYNAKSTIRKWKENKRMQDEILVQNLAES